MKQTHCPHHSQSTQRRDAPRALAWVSENSCLRIDRHNCNARYSYESRGLRSHSHSLLPCQCGYSRLHAARRAVRLEQPHDYDPHHHTRNNRRGGARGGGEQAAEHGERHAARVGARVGLRDRRRRGRRAVRGTSCRSMPVRCYPVGRRPGRSRRPSHSSIAKTSTEARLASIQYISCSSTRHARPSKPLTSGGRVVWTGDTDADAYAWCGTVSRDHNSTSPPEAARVSARASALLGVAGHSRASSTGCCLRQPH